MIAIDPKAGTHFLGRVVQVSRHAIDEAVKEFEIPEEEAERFIISNLQKSQFVDVINGDYGKGQLVRLFGHDRIAFVVSTYMDKVITVYRRKTAAAEIRNPIEDLVNRELRRINKRLAAAEKKTKKEGLDLKVQLAEHQRTAGLSGSERLRAKAEAEIWRIRKYLDDMESELVSLRAYKARLANGIVAYM